MKEKQRISEGIFFVALSIWLVVQILNRTLFKQMLPIPYKEVKLYGGYLVLIILAIKFIYDRSFTKKDIFGWVIVGYMYYVSVLSTETLVFIVAALVVSAHNVNLRRILKFMFAFFVLQMTIIVGSSLLGIIENKVWFDGVRERYGFGYTYFSYLSHFLFYGTLLYMCIRRKCNLAEMFVLLGLNYLVYYYTKTRLDFYLGCAMPVTGYVLGQRKKPLKQNILTVGAFELCMPICAAGIIGITYIYDAGNQLMVQLNALFSDRFNLGKTAMNQYGFTIWGQEVNYVTHSKVEKHPNLVYNFVDSSYIQIALQFGLVLLVLLCIGFGVAGYFAVKRNEVFLCVAILFMVLQCTIDPQFRYMEFNPFLFVLSPYLGANSYTERVRLRKNG